MIRNRSGYQKVDRELVDAVSREIKADMDLYRAHIDEFPEGKGFFGRPARSFRDRQRSASMMRRDVRRELLAVKRIEDRLGRVKNPQIRKLVYEILEEAGEQGLDINDVLGSFPRGRGHGLGDFLGLGTDRSLPWIIGAAALGLALYPAARENLKKLAGRLTEEATEISDKMQEMVSRTREEMEDIVAEAQFSKIQESMLNGNNDGKSTL